MLVLFCDNVTDYGEISLEMVKWHFHDFDMQKTDFAVFDTYLQTAITMALFLVRRLYLVQNDKLRFISLVF